MAAKTASVVFSQVLLRANLKAIEAFQQDRWPLTPPTLHAQPDARDWIAAQTRYVAWYDSLRSDGIGHDQAAETASGIFTLVLATANIKALQQDRWPTLPMAAPSASPFGGGDDLRLRWQMQEMIDLQRQQMKIERDREFYRQLDEMNRTMGLPPLLR